jgi:O-antigen/teichoic acid export membrane protein
MIGLLELGLSMVLTQRLSKSFSKSEDYSFKCDVHSGIRAASFLFVSAVITTIFISPIAVSLTRVAAGHETDMHVSFILLGIGAAGSIYSNFLGSILQSLLKAGALGIANLLASIAGLLVLFLAFNHYGTLSSIAIGLFTRVWCANMLLSVIVLRELARKKLLPQSNSQAHTINLLKLCLPIFVGTIAKSSSETAVSLVLVNFINPGAVAILALNQKVMQACNMVLAPIGSSIFSAMTQIKEKMSDEKFSSLIAITIRLHFLISVILIGSAVVFNEVIITIWVGEDKFAGYAVSVMLGISSLIQSRYTLSCFLIYSLGGFNRLVKIEILYSALKLILVIFLINPIGFTASPLAELVASFLCLYTLTGRIISNRIMLSSFRDSLFTLGWLEFFSLLIVGKLYVSTFPESTTTLYFISRFVLFVFVAAFLLTALNLGFIKRVKRLFN